MIKFLRDNYERVLVILAFTGLLILIGYFIWGGRFLTSGFNKALKVEGGGKEVVKFDLEGVKALNLEINL